LGAGGVVQSGIDETAVKTVARLVIRAEPATEDQAVVEENHEPRSRL